MRRYRLIDRSRHGHELQRRVRSRGSIDQDHDGFTRVHLIPTIGTDPHQELIRRTINFATIRSRNFPASLFDSGNFEINHLDADFSVPFFLEGLKTNPFLSFFSNRE